MQPHLPSVFPSVNGGNESTYLGVHISTFLAVVDLLFYVIVVIKCTGYTFSS